MFDFGLSTSHVLVIVVLAVIAIGPKDLPVVLRRFGQFMNKMRGMARDFQGQVDTAMKDAGMEGLHEDIKALRTGVTAAVSPMQAMVSSSLNSAMTTSALSSSATTSTATTPVLTSNNGFNDYFGQGVGETRVAGRDLQDEKA